MQLLPPDPPQPPLVRRWWTAIAATVVAVIFTPPAALAIGAWLFGLSQGLLLGVFCLSMVMLILPWVMVLKRQGVIERLRKLGWQACTACACPLPPDSKQCPECGVNISLDEALPMWQRSAWARSR